ncbi:amino acid ABC transporter substrate-binding protein [Achromobacter denitrificans]|uniref:Amino acid ABC transporter substrate-binding protein n=3 Tax=Achromobacter denitrificans TaxID=32002 RepID=A0A3R9MPL1_ACHDE|nr:MULTISPECIES: amino acid ABC transporter substrate-binding protein [Achromobacter]ASC65866.1 amino acid ABC transporter substrate-binding protein [Achromobacter denitrificans]MBV2161696.1 amino acid ABC transporter substrate-binding protein [Achromobacter denitrificans]MDX3878215.1 amino acid ABC transporter substrate-binding protein [Achromobacter sp.]MPT39667.1 amino acid ABC transporter substrate-binding protein [Achromobacter sp.]OLU09517.1 amino acid ABC transporter substrate-binding p
MPLRKLAACALALAAVSSQAHAGPTLDTVKKRGYVQCGVSTGIQGFSAPDGKGVWRGLDVDMCRAIAAAVFNDATRFRLTPLTTQARFTALQSGEVDVLTRNVTPTMARDTTLGLLSVAVNFYDSQGVMVSRKLGIKALKELDGATICVQPGTVTELDLADWFRSRSLRFKPVVIEKFDEIVRAFSAGRCDAFTSDKSQLAATRMTLEDPDGYEILQENISKSPLGPMVRQGDDNWINVVRWSFYAMLEAEEFGISSANVDAQLQANNPNVQRILGVTPGMGRNMGVDDKWAYHIVKQVGNYGESYERNLGMSSPMKLPRALNAQWRDGGLMYGWPVR